MKIHRKWRSKASGVEYDAYDSFSGMRHEVSLFLTGDDMLKFAPRARLTYSELVEAFERVEEITEGMYDGWDTE